MAHKASWQLTLFKKNIYIYLVMCKEISPRAIGNTWSWTRVLDIFNPYGVPEDTVWTFISLHFDTRVFLRKSLPHICTLLCLTHSKRKRKNCLLLPGILLVPVKECCLGAFLTHQDTQQKQSPHFLQMQQAGPCVLISADLPEQGKNSFSWRMVSTVTCWTGGFTCAPGNISISKKPGSLQHWSLATKGHLFLSSGYVIHSTIKPMNVLQVWC